MKVTKKINWFHGCFRAAWILIILLVPGAEQALSGNEKHVKGKLQQVHPESKTIWDGVYTNSQAIAGTKLFDAHCDACHGLVIAGDGEFKGPELKGEIFFENWREDHLWSLFRKIRSSMPMFQPPLKDSEYLLIVTHILNENGFPKGSMDLDFDGLRTVRVEALEGPKPLPTGSLVQTVGCLASVQGDWALEKASKPIRNRDPDPERPMVIEDLEDAANAPEGTLTFQLTNFFMLGDFDPTAFEGRRILVKGALMRRSSGDRISLTGVDMVASTCNSGNSR